MRPDIFVIVPLRLDIFLAVALSLLPGKCILKFHSKYQTFPLCFHNPTETNHVREEKYNIEGNNSAFYIHLILYFTFSSSVARFINRRSLL